MFEPVVGKWSMGPPLPKESFVTTDKKIRFRGYSLGKYKPLILYSLGINSVNC